MSKLKQPFFKDLTDQLEENINYPELKTSTVDYLLTTDKGKIAFQVLSEDSSSIRHTYGSLLASRGVDELWLIDQSNQMLERWSDPRENSHAKFGHWYYQVRGFESVEEVSSPVLDGPVKVSSLL